MGTGEATDDPGVPLPGGYAAHVMRRAVLVPLRGKLPERAAIVRGAAAVRKCWRARVGAFEERGWKPALGPTKWRMIHCRSVFTLPDLKGRFCGYRAICPHCWARQVLETWTTIDKGLFPPRPVVLPPRRPGVRQVRGLIGEHEPHPRARHARLDHLVLFERRVEYRIPFENWFPDQPPGVRSLRHWIRIRLQPKLAPTGVNIFLNRQGELRRLAALGCTGILDVTRPLLDRGDDRAAAPVGWRVQVRQVIAVPCEAAEAVAINRRMAGEPPSMGGVKGNLTLVRHDGPTRRLVMNAVARAMAYPRMLLHGPPKLALEVLKARGTFRMIATTGLFRGGPGQPENRLAPPSTPG